MAAAAPWWLSRVDTLACQQVPSLCFSPHITCPASPCNYNLCCRQRQAELARRAAQERAADEAIVQEGLQAAAAAEAHERAAREARRAAAVAYREQVVAQMEREQANTAARDAQLAAAMEAQQAKREAEQAARDAARCRLMQDVCATREQQLAAKQAARAMEAEAALRQRLAAEEEARREAEVAEARRQLERQQQLQQRHDLQARRGMGSWLVAWWCQAVAMPPCTTCTGTTTCQTARWHGALPNSASRHHTSPCPCHPSAAQPTCRPR